MLQRLVLWTGGMAVVNEESDVYDAFEEMDPDQEPADDEPPATSVDGFLEDGITSVEQLQPLWEHLDRLERLSTLGLCNFAGSTGEVAVAMAAHPFWTRIETLDLTRGRVRAADTEGLLAALRNATRLKTLVVEQAQIDDTALAALLDLGIELTGEPRTPFEQYRFVVTRE